MKIIFFVITFITFILFFAEALIHFNIGKKAANTHKYFVLNMRIPIRIHIPDKKEFIGLFFTVLFFSTFSGLLSAYIIKTHLT